MSPISKRSILLRYNEVALKGGNRRAFERRLVDNLYRLVKRVDPTVGPQQIRREFGRIFFDAECTPVVASVLERTFGLVGFSPVRSFSTTLSQIESAVIDEVERWIDRNGLPINFGVDTRRSDKRFPMTSVELNEHLGSKIRGRFGEIPVKIKKAHLHIGVEIRFPRTYCWTEKFEGPGGLPVGVSGAALSLLSGGIDSPVASLLAMKRGIPLKFVHFFGAPFVGVDVLEKVERLARRVQEFSPDPIEFLVIPFGPIQERIAASGDSRYRTLLFRRSMMRVSTEVAKQRNLTVLLTGENVAQVSSQTLENMAAIEEAAGIPVLRPLVTYDKSEIIQLAERWGTFATSILPGEDCCTLLADRNPETRARVDRLLEEESHLGMEALEVEALEKMEVHHLQYQQMRTALDPLVKSIQ